MPRKVRNVRSKVPPRPPRPPHPSGPSGPSRPSGSSRPSVLESIKSGFGLGLGMEAARAAISSVALPSPATSKDDDDACKFEKQLVFQCLQEQTMDSPNTCQNMIDLYRQCHNANHHVNHNVVS